MGTLIIVACTTVFLGLVASLVVLYISEEKEMNGFDESVWVEQPGEETTSFEKKLENYIIEERSRNNGTSRLLLPEDDEPVVDTLSDLSISNSMPSNLTKRRRRENIILSLN